MNGSILPPMMESLPQIPHLVDLPNPKECPHEEILYFHADMNIRASGEAKGTARGTVRAVRLTRRTRVLDLGDMWQPTLFSQATGQGPVEANLSAPLHAEAARRAFAELEWHRQRIADLTQAVAAGKRPSHAAVQESVTYQKIRKGVVDGEATIHLPPLHTSDLPRTWVTMRRQRVRILADYWETEDGRVW